MLNFNNNRFVVPFFYDDDDPSGKADEQIEADKTVEKTEDAEKTVETEKESEYTPSKIDKHADLEEMEAELDKSEKASSDEGADLSAEVREDVTAELEPEAKEEKTEEKPEGKPEDKPEVKESEADKTVVDEDKTKPIEITEEYIASQPEEDREALQSIKGEKISPKMLKIHVHSQDYISKLKEEETIADKIVEEDKIELPKSNERLDKYSDEQLTALKNMNIVKGIQRQYPDFPDDGLTNDEALNDFYRDIQDEKPAKYDDFKDTVRNVRDSVTEQIDTQVEIGKNWKKYAGKAIQDSYDSFKTFIDAKGLTPEALGINFKDTALAKEILYDENGGLNEDVAFMQNGVPIIVPAKFTHALKEKFIDQMFLVKEKDARADGFTKRTEVEPAASIANSNVAGVTDHVKPLATKITPDMDPEEMEKILDKHETTEFVKP